MYKFDKDSTPYNTYWHLSETVLPTSVSLPSQSDRTVTEDGRIIPPSTLSERVAKALRKHTLSILVLLAVVAGYAIGLILRQWRSWSKTDIKFLSFPGELFTRCLLCMVLPLIVTSIVVAIGTGDIRVSRKLALYSFVYFAITTLMAACMGLLVVLAVQPGKGIAKTTQEFYEPKRIALIADNFLDLVRNIFIPNLVKACFTQDITNLTPPVNADKYFSELDALKKFRKRPLVSLSELNTDTKDKEFPPLELWTINIDTIDHVNYLGIGFCAIIFGFSLNIIKEQGVPMLMIFIALQKVIRIIVHILTGFIPLGIFFLIVSKLVNPEKPTNLLILAVYSATVITGCALHSLCTLTVLFIILVRKLPFRFWIKISEAMLTAFLTSSSAATLPITIACMEKCKIDPRVISFLVPIGSTINMDGTALYLVITAVFVAQMRNIAMTLMQICFICITASVVSVGVAGIKLGGFTSLVIVFNAAGLSVDDITLVYTVDWLLNRFRTVVNVYSDCVGAAVINTICRNDLKKSDPDLTTIYTVQPNLRFRSKYFYSHKSPSRRRRQYIL